MPAAAGVVTRGTVEFRVPGEPRCPLLPGPPAASPCCWPERGPCSANGTGSGPAPPGAAGAAGANWQQFSSGPSFSGCRLRSPISLSNFLPHTAHHVPGHQAGQRPGCATIWAGKSLRFSPCAPPSIPTSGWAHSPFGFFSVSISSVHGSGSGASRTRGKVTPVTDYFLNSARAGLWPSRFPLGGRAVCWQGRRG